MIDKLLDWLSEHECIGVPIGLTILSFGITAIVAINLLILRVIFKLLGIL